SALLSYPQGGTLARASPSRIRQPWHQGSSLQVHGRRPMGAVPLPRKNPFMAQGLLPGTTLRLDVSSGGQGETHVTRVEDVDNQPISILVPMRGLRPRPF